TRFPILSSGGSRMITSMKQLAAAIPEVRLVGLHTPAAKAFRLCGPIPPCLPHCKPPCLCFAYCTRLIAPDPPYRSRYPELPGPLPPNPHSPYWTCFGYWPGPLPPYSCYGGCVIPIPYPIYDPPVNNLNPIVNVPINVIGPSKPSDNPDNQPMIGGKTLKEWIK